jgi:ABC-type sugar transport system permease subunit
MLPYILPLAVMGSVFTFMLLPVDGLISEALQALQLSDGPVNLLSNRWSALAILILIHTWTDFGFTMILALAAMQTIPKSLYESAELDGAGAFRRFQVITLPMIRGTLSVIFFLAVLSAVRSFDLVKVITGGGPAGSTEVMFTHVFNAFFGGAGTSAGEARIGYGAAGAIVTSLFVMAVVAIRALVIRRRNGAE